MQRPQDDSIRDSNTAALYSDTVIYENPYAVSPEGIKFKFDDLTWPDEALDEYGDVKPGWSIQDVPQNKSITKQN